MNDILPKRFKIPQRFSFYINQMIKIDLIPLTISVSEIDFSLVQKNYSHLKGLFGHLDDWWPSDSLTQQMNDELLLWHENQWKTRNSFSYQLHFNNIYCGCLYIYSYNDEISQIVDAKNTKDLFVFMWTSKIYYDIGFDRIIFDEMNKWIERIWYFSKAEYPGRTIPLKSFSKDTSSWILTTI